MTRLPNGSRADIAIIGGGLAGISCALALRPAGQRVVLFDKARTLGGRAGSGRHPTTGQVIDSGPHIFLSEYRNTLDMFEGLGTRRDVLWQNDQFITLLDHGRKQRMRIHPLPAPLHLVPSLLQVESLSLADKLSNGRMTWLAMRAREEQRLAFDDMSARELLVRCGVSARLQQWFWATATLALLNVPLEECSGAALLRMYAHLIGRSGYRSGFAQKPLPDLFVPQATALLENTGSRIETDAQVTRLNMKDGTLRSLQLSDGREIHTDVCVSTLPPADLACLLDRSGLLDERRRRMLSRFRPAPYVSTYLWLDRKVTRERFWGRVWSRADWNCDFYDLSNIRRDVDPQRSLIASNAIHKTGANLSDAEIVARTYVELCEFAPHARSAKVLHAVVNRIPMAVTCPNPGTERVRPDGVTTIDGLLLAGDWTNTHLPSCMESAVYSGRLAARIILNGLTRQHSPPIPPPSPTGFVRLTRRLLPRPHGLQSLASGSSGSGTDNTSRSCFCNPRAVARGNRFQRGNSHEDSNATVSSRIARDRDDSDPVERRMGADIDDGHAEVRR